MQKVLASAFVFLGVSVTSGSAATITETYIFSLGGFVDVGSDVSSPAKDISGSFTVTFDPTQNYTNDTSDLVVNSFGGTTVSSQLGFTYFASNKFFFFGGVQNNSDFQVAGTNDFTLSYNLSNPSSPQFLLCSASGIVCASQTGNSAYTASGYTSADHGSSDWVSAFARSVANGGTVASEGPSPSDFVVKETAPADGQEGQYTLTNNSSGWWVTGFEVTNPSAAEGDDSTTRTNWTAGVCVSCASLPVFTYSDNVLLDYANYIAPDGGTSSNFFFTGPPDSSVAVDLVNAEGQTFQLALGTPEPSTWAMMLIGFAGLSLVGFRASRGTSTAG